MGRRRARSSVLSTSVKIKSNVIAFSLGYEFSHREYINTRHSIYEVLRTIYQYHYRDTPVHEEQHNSSSALAAALVF